MEPEVEEWFSRDLLEDIAIHKQNEYTIRELDFSNVPDIFFHRDPLKKNWDAPRPRTASGHLLTTKHIKQRAKSKLKKIANDELNLLYKPVEEWDMEELAAGRPRNSIGTFAGAPPAFVTRAVHETAMERFKALVKSDMNTHTIKALSTLDVLLSSQEVDDKGKPIVPWSTKADVAKFLLEHIVGKPTQRVETDISVKLQGILGTVMINPDVRNAGEMKLAHLPGVTMPMADAREDDDDMYIDAE